MSIADEAVDSIENFMAFLTSMRHRVPTPMLSAEETRRALVAGAGIVVAMAGVLASEAGMSEDEYLQMVAARMIADAEAKR